MARVIISDAGPLIALAGTGLLFVLQTLFSEICIAKSVKRECLAKSGLDAEGIEASIHDGWIHVFKNHKDSKPLSPALGLGESDSIRYAMEHQEEALLIVDDRLARRFALKQGVSIVGTVRILDLAEQRGLIESAEYSIDEMAKTGYRISIEILKQIRSK